jgi:hypothetical protein
MIAETVLSTDRRDLSREAYEMSARNIAAWGAAASVVLTGISAALINELHGGWGWWVAASAVVLITALLAGWLALRAAGRGGDRLAAGAVKADRDITGNVETHFAEGSFSEGGVLADGDQLGPGAVKAGRDIRGDVRTAGRAVPPIPPQP